jgi:glyoxylase I family protein
MLSMTALELRHTGIVVSDIKKAKVFYCDYLGLEIQKDFSESGAYIDTLTQTENTDLHMIKCTTPDGGMVELLEFKNPKSNPRNKSLNTDLGANHLAFTVKNLDETVAFLKEKNVQFQSEICTSPDLYAKVVFCRDPDGTLVELVEVINPQNG